ncbi:ABC transporter substrate-binding protein [bacterium]|nr:ABC transporter substrate-binding protein [bacterium]
MALLITLLFLAFPAHAVRLVTTTPQTTELVFQLGWGSSLVGVGVGSAYPPEAAKLPTVGQLFSPSVERTLALAPDWVILDSHTLHPPYQQALEALKVPTLVWDTQSPGAVLTGARALEAKLGKAPRSPVQSLQRCWQKAQHKISGKTFLAFVWLDPPIVSGPGAYLSAILEGVGYTPALALGRARYLPVSEEWLVQQSVDEVFFLEHGSDSRASTLERFARWWPAKKPRYTALDADLFARASFTPLFSLSLLLGAQAPGECHE